MQRILLPILLCVSVVHVASAVDPKTDGSDIPDMVKRIQSNRCLDRDFDEKTGIHTGQVPVDPDQPIIKLNDGTEIINYMDQECFCATQVFDEKNAAGDVISTRTEVRWFLSRVDKNRNPLGSKYDPDKIENQKKGIFNGAQEVDYCIKLDEPLGSRKAIYTDKGAGGFGLIGDTIKAGYKYVVPIGGVAGVGIIGFSGIQLSLGGLSDAMVKSAKKNIVRWAIIMFMLFIGIPMAARFILPGFFVIN